MAHFFQLHQHLPIGLSKAVLGRCSLNGLGLNGLAIGQPGMNAAVKHAGVVMPHNGKHPEKTSRFTATLIIIGHDMTLCAEANFSKQRGNHGQIG